jgi:hypothetical protein
MSASERKADLAASEASMSALWGKAEMRQRHGNFAF